MEEKNNNISSAEARAQMLAELKRAKAILTSTYQSENNDVTSTEEHKVNLFDDMISEHNSLYAEEGEQRSNNSHRKSLATPAGRAMVSPEERGYTSAIMLGIMTFFIEVAFLAITFFMYR